MASPASLGSVALLVLAAASCGGTTSGSATAVDSGATTQDSGQRTRVVDAAKDSGSGRADAGKDATARTPEAGPSDGGSDSVVIVDAGGDADADAGDTSIDIPLDAPPGVGIDGGTAPITGVPAGQWTWVPFPDAKCRDGSSTGIGLNLNPSSTNLMIFLEGGGACFNAIVCTGNPPSFAEPDFDARFDITGANPGGGADGILDRTNSANPVQDWNYVYVPYCTGDIHTGNNPSGVVSGVTGSQAFVGYVDIDLYLQRLVPTFSSLTQILLTGVSGGGFGAAANYVHVARAFGNVPVNLIDDSGPFMQNPYLATCLTNEVRLLWNADATVGVDCAGDCDQTPTFFLDYARHITKTYPQRQFGLMDSLDDSVITAFFGFAINDCTGLGRESETMFTAGLDDIRTQLAATGNFGGFYFPGTDHTSLESPVFYTRMAGTVPLTSWVSQLIGGSATNAGP